VLDVALPAALPAPPPFARLGLWPLIGLLGGGAIVLVWLEISPRRAR